MSLRGSGRALVAALLLTAAVPALPQAPGTPGASLQPTTSPEERDAARLALGQRLFFDPILSLDRSISCASCHKPEFAFADNRPLSPGVDGKLGSRNTPTVMNASGRASLFWDGRAATLEDQAVFPIENPVEMALPIAAALQRLAAEPAYVKLFRTAYGGAITARTVGRALAAFQKTLETVDTPYDRYAHGDATAISESAVRGRLLFIGRGKCAECHSGEDFTSERFRNIGLYDGVQLADPGRGAITGNAAENGEFKIPTLRNVAVTAPYMHNGMFRSLREVIDYYDEPDRFVPKAIGRDVTMLARLELSEQDRQDLEAFLEALTDDRFRAQK